MAQIVNLRTARKAAARAAKERAAHENRVRFGRTRAEKARDKDEEARAARAASQAKLDR